MRYIGSPSNHLLLAVTLAACADQADPLSAPVEVASSTQALTSDPYCADGILDASGRVCCPESCGSCGGGGCSGRPGGAAACCTSFVLDSGRSCDVTGAPCAVVGDAACRDGVAYGTGAVCCPDFCGSCGGSGCSGRRGGSENCCVSDITANAPSCELDQAPCVLEGDPACEYGLLDSAGAVCCPESCGSCGGGGCSDRPGGAAACCQSHILSAGNSCLTGKAPCVIESDPQCDSGLLDPTGQACCPASCGSCGGADCSQRPGGADACCRLHIVADGRSCVTHEAPCVVERQGEPFVHPGLLSTEDELYRLSTRVLVGAQPSQEAWYAMRSNPLASLSYAHRAYQVVYVKGGSPTPESEAQIKQDAQAAYLHALQFAIASDMRHADKAKAILTDWARELRRIEPLQTNQPKQPRLEAAWIAPMFAAAGEIIRHHQDGSAGWAQSDIVEFSRMLDLLVHHARPEITDASNWGTSAALAFVAVGVFNDDRQLYEEGLHAWKNLLPTVVDASGFLPEFRRREDCYHAHFTVLGLAQAAEIAWHQGDDLYAYRIGNESRSRLDLALEYSSSLYLGNTTVTLSDGSEMSCIGELSSGYDMPLNHYKHRAQLPASQLAALQQATEEKRPDGARSMFLGWTTLTHGELLE